MLSLVSPRRALATGEGASLLRVPFRSQLRVACLLGLFADGAQASDQDGVKHACLAVCDCRARQLPQGFAMSLRPTKRPALLPRARQYGAAAAPVLVDAIVEEVRAATATGHEVVVVTADRELRERVAAAGGSSLGPSWLLDQLP